MTGDELRRIIGEAGITNEEAIKRLKVSRSTLQKWLAGNNPISYVQAAGIRAILTSTIEGETVGEKNLRNAE